LASAMVPYFSLVRPTRHVFEPVLSVISRMVLTSVPRDRRPCKSGRLTTSRQL
jgi:hypothetical protein